MFSFSSLNKHYWFFFSISNIWDKMLSACVSVCVWVISSQHLRQHVRANDCRVSASSHISILSMCNGLLPALLSHPHHVSHQPLPSRLTSPYRKPVFRLSLSQLHTMPILVSSYLPISNTRYQHLAFENYISDIWYRVLCLYTMNVWYAPYSAYTSSTTIQKPLCSWPAAIYSDTKFLTRTRAYI